MSTFVIRKSLRAKAQKALSALLTATTALSLSGLSMFAPAATLAAVSSSSLVDGDLIRVEGTVDIYIAKIVTPTEKYRRLILNETIFDSYGHLEWGNVKEVSQATMDEFTKTQFVRVSDPDAGVDDPKVYYLEETGLDTGTRRHVDVSGQQFVDEGNDFDGVFIANIFEVGNDSNTGIYTGGSPVTTTVNLPNFDGGSSTPVAGSLSVFAASQPANALAPYNATRVAFTRFSVTNTGSSAQTIDNVTVERTGAALDTNFTGVVLLDENDNQLGVARVLNSEHMVTIGEAVTLNPGQTRTFTVAGNMAAAATVSNGQIASFTVKSVNTSATVSGSLPITGASHTISSNLAIGTATVARGPLDPAADKSKEVGTTGYTFSSLKVTAGSAENIRVHSIRWNMSGSAASTDLANVVVVIDGTEYPTTVSADGKYYTADFGAGVVIAKGNTEEFSVKGDIVGGATRTITFDIWDHVDIHVTGEVYGYGLRADDGDTTTGTSTEGTYNDELTAAYPAYDVTILAGTVNAFSKSNAVLAGNIAEQVNDTTLGAFELNLTGEGMTVTTVKLALDTAEDSGSDVDADDITLITLVDQNDKVLAGPADGSATDYTPTSGTASEGSVSFSGVDFEAGVTTIFVKGKLGSDFANADTVTVRANPGDWTGAKGVSTGQTISFTSSESSANAQTVQAATLAATTLTQPAARNVVKGTTDFTWLTGSLDAANSGEDIRVTSLTVVDTTTATSTAADIDSFEIWANLSGGSALDSVRGDTFETLIASGDNFSDTDAGDDETLTITLDTVIVVPKNTSIEIAGIGDLAGGATGVAGTDSHTLDFGTVTAAGTNTGTDATDSSVAGSGQAMTVQANGTLTVTVDSSSPSAGLLLDDTSNEQTAGIFRLAANNVEDLDVDSIKLTSDGAGDAIGSYVFYHGATKLGTVTGGQDTAELFLTDGTLTIPADDHVLITVKVVMNNIDGTQVANADAVEVTIAAAGDVDTTGNGSGAAVDSTDTSVDAATHTVYESYPTFAFDNTGVSTTLGKNTNYLAAKIVITNAGNKDIIFDSDDSLQVNFEIGGTLNASASAVTAIETSSGNTLDQVAMGATTGSTSADINFGTNTLTIPVGGSKEIQIRVNTGGTNGLGTDGDTLQAWLSDDADANMEFRIDGDATDYNEATNVFKGDIYGPSHVNPS